MSGISGVILLVFLPWAGISLCLCLLIVIIKRDVEMKTGGPSVVVGLKWRHDWNAKTA
jgi:hypothetical protein